MTNFALVTKTVVLKYAGLIGLLCLFVFTLFCFSHPALAAVSTTSLSQTTAAAGLPTTSLPILIARGIRIFLGTLGVICILIVIYAGWLYLSARGDDTNVKKAKKILFNAVIGLVLILGSYSIASFILSKLLEAINGNATITATTKKYAEPLAGSLGAGIIESHYPVRDAIDIPRNTKIFVTFKEPIDPATIIDGYNASLSSTDTNQSTHLKADDVKIYEDAKGESGALGSTDVIVKYALDPNTHQSTFVFKPVNYLGNSQSDVTYSVYLKAGIKKADHKAAFAGKESSGYLWSFTVSTVIDLTPPRVITVMPSSGIKHARNESVEMTFSEAMDPIAGTGTYNPVTAGDGSVTGPTFSNIATSFSPPDGSDSVEHGTYSISNGYKTIDFTTTQACAKDPCGNTIYCLPGSKQITVTAKAAPLDPNNIPQALMTNTSYDGLVDAAGNSLDGNGDGKGEGPSADNYNWGFSTSDVIDSTVPSITSLAPGILQGNIDTQNDVTATFNTLLLSMSLDSTNVSIWPDKKYPMWFTIGKEDLSLPTQPTLPPPPPSYSVVQIHHAPFITKTDGGSDYWPVFTQNIRGANQFCMFPASGPSSSTGAKCSGDSSLPYCCNGIAQATACVNGSLIPLPPPAQ